MRAKDGLLQLLVSFFVFGTLFLSSWVGLLAESPLLYQRLYCSLQEAYGKGGDGHFSRTCCDRTKGED